MEEQNHKNHLQFSPLAMDWIASNASGSLGDFDSNQHNIMTAGIGACQWHCQPTPQNYVRFLAETGHPEIQEQMSYVVSAQFPTLGLPNPSQFVRTLHA